MRRTSTRDINNFYAKSQFHQPCWSSLSWPFAWHPSASQSPLWSPGNLPHSKPWPFETPSRVDATDASVHRNSPDCAFLVLSHSRMRLLPVWIVITDGAGPCRKHCSLCNEGNKSQEYHNLLDTMPPQFPFLKNNVGPVREPFSNS